MSHCEHGWESIHCSVGVVVMYSLEDLQSDLGLTYEQLRYRLKKLAPVLGPHVTHGKKGKLLITSNGLQIIRRLADLEKDGISVELACETISRELTKSASDNGFVNTNDPQPDPKDDFISYLKREIEQLHELLREKDKQIGQLQSIIEQRLPALPASPQQNQPRRSWWGRLWGR
jgi:hypothetical protein